MSGRDGDWGGSGGEQGAGEYGSEDGRTSECRVRETPQEGEVVWVGLMPPLLGRLCVCRFLVGQSALSGGRNRPGF